MFRTSIRDLVRSRNPIRTIIWTMMLAVTTAAMLCGVATIAAPPGVGSLPPGRIYFGRYELKDSSIGAYWELIGYWSMRADGSNKVQVLSYPYAGAPNRNRVTNGSWILSSEAVPGTYPNGTARRELFATDELSGDKIQLTDDASLQTYSIQTAHGWAHDDSFISFAAVTWTAVASDGNFTDDIGQEWSAESAVFIAQLDWSTGSPVVDSPVSVLPGGNYWESGGAVGHYFRPDIVAMDWSPSGDTLVYEQITQDLQSGREYSDLYVASWNNGVLVGIIPLGPGREPEWSPDGARIAYWRSDAGGQNIWLVNPDGIAASAITSGGTGGPDHAPHWSTDSKHLTFTRRFHNKKRGTSGPYTVTSSAVMRIPATGGTVVNLTKDLSDSAKAVAWR